MAGGAEQKPSPKRQCQADATMSDILNPRYIKETNKNENAAHHG